MNFRAPAGVFALATACNIVVVAAAQSPPPNNRPGLGELPVTEPVVRPDEDLDLRKPVFLTRGMWLCPDDTRSDRARSTARSNYESNPTVEGKNRLLALGCAYLLKGSPVVVRDVIDSDSITVSPNKTSSMRATIWGNDLRNASQAKAAPQSPPQAATKTDAATDGKTVQWDQTKAFQNARFNQATIEARICLKDGMTIALRGGERNRDRISSFGISLCKAQLTLVSASAKIAKASDEQTRDLLLSLVDAELDQLLRSGR
jgi:hypothetical protein